MSEHRHNGDAGPCITEHMMLKHLKGKTSASEEAVIYAHIDACELCAEAFDGIKALGIIGLGEAMADLRARGKKRFGAKVVALPIRFVAVAASIAVLATTAWFWIGQNLDSSSNQSELATVGMNDATEPMAARPVAVNADTFDSAMPLEQPNIVPPPVEVAEEMDAARPDDARITKPPALDESVALGSRSELSKPTIQPQGERPNGTRRNAIPDTVDMASGSDDYESVAPVSEGRNAVNSRNASTAQSAEIAEALEDMNNGRYRSALRKLKRAEKDGGSDHLAISMARCYWGLNQLSRAEDELRPLSAKVGVFRTDAQLLLAKVRIAQGNNEEARSLLQTVKNAGGGHAAEAAKLLESME